MIVSGCAVIRSRSEFSHDIIVKRSMLLTPGNRLGPYEILASIGAGGMGEVYKARDTRLDRFVAIKLMLSPAGDDRERINRFMVEARSAGALNHPNIVAIYDLGMHEGAPYMVSELLEGEGLRARMDRGRLSLAEVLDFARQTVQGMASAHARGITHRDIKPENLFITNDGRLKVLDFGLAQMQNRGRSANEEGATLTQVTTAGSIMGTVSYMSPEQAEGRPVSAASDVFSFGVVLYEMLCGRRPFDGATSISVITAILRDPPPLGALGSDVPAEWRRVVSRCLEKDPRRRYASGVELLEDLRTAPGVPVSRPLWAKRWAAGAAVAILVAGGAWWWHEQSRVRWARNEALPEIERLNESLHWYKALRLLREAERYIPKDPDLRRLKGFIAMPVNLRSDPPGALVSMQEYSAPGSSWEDLGKTPVENATVPLGMVRIRLVHPESEPLEIGWNAVASRTLNVRLVPKSRAPGGMVLVPEANADVNGAPTKLPECWLDRYEVTNRQFKSFLDQGGYQKVEYWKHRFLTSGKELARQEAMNVFRDSTGRPGPSTWALETYPDGQADYPVGGVSWYEAAAYAEFAGKSLPTLHHWRAAAGFTVFSDIAEASNFSHQGPARVGTYAGLGPYGTFDMAGNVKEWCWNESGVNRFILGGAWNEPQYLFREYDARDPMAREANFGFRCARYINEPPKEVFEPIVRSERDYSREKPVSDESFALFQSLYSYDNSLLDVKVESTDDTTYWRQERVSFLAAYGGERVPAVLFTPRNAAPPYQVVVYFASSIALAEPSSWNLEPLYIDMLLRTGRAVLYPIVKGTYERRVRTTGLNSARDLIIQESKDIRRSLDFLLTRADVDRDRISYLGFSRGAVLSPMMLAFEPRFKTAVLIAGGLPLNQSAPEADPLNFLPRIHMPVLIVNGRNDFARPYATSQVPMLRFLGTSAKDKHLEVFDSGHAPPVIPTARVVLEWLDRHLGAPKLKH